MMKIITRIVLSSLTAFLSLMLATNVSAQRVNKLIELFENGEPGFGVLSFDYSLNNARSLATSGLDFVFIDMEHAPFDVERLREFLLGMTNKRSILEKGNLQPDVVPLVRIPAAGGAEELISQAKQVLDVGVFGIFFPAVHTREQAELAVRATRYPQYNGASDFEPAGLREEIPLTLHGTGVLVIIMLRRTFGPLIRKANS